jgi:hypothetical protein
MRTSNFMGGAFAFFTLAMAAACGAPAGEETATKGDAIVNGTPQHLTANSFVELNTRDCTGTLLTNQWVLTANHCGSQVGDDVTMDSQGRTVARVVHHPDVQYGVDIALLQLTAPMSINGSLTGFSRALRTTVAPPGTHLRCFGYGLSVNLSGITDQLGLMEIPSGGGANNVYTFEANAFGQSAAPGDAGGGCLDDTGAAVAVMLTFAQAPSQPGETFAITSSYYASWASFVINGQCTVNSDCTTGICNTITHACVTSTCQDGVRDGTETGVDCGGPCPRSCPCPIGTHNCGGTCVPNGRLCP